MRRDTPKSTQFPRNTRAASGTLDPVIVVALGDALEQAGCDDAEVLAHLRSPGCM
ncbi:MAG TPA: hypothetical protein VFA18_17050 [Gemmataceae bacterium]|nr:hypothetical protein [Gemmataceae bacterium]